MVAPAERDLLHQILDYRAEKAEQETEDLREPGSRRLLSEIREALGRLNSGTYGYCDACFMTIPWGELIAVPERRRCARCSPALEEVLG